jgi:hypothetical protein
MLLLIMCGDLEVADRRLTPAIQLVFAPAFVSSSTSLVRPLMSHRVLHRGPFAPRSSSPLGLHLGPQLLLERLVLADAPASTLPARGCRALGAPGTHLTRRSRKRGRLAADHGDALATRTGDLHPRTVQGEIRLRAQRTTLRPGAGDPGHPLRRPLGNPWAAPGPQLDIELQQAGGFLPLRGQQLDCLLLRLMRRADHHLPDACALHLDGNVLGEAVAGCRTAAPRTINGD